MRKDGLAASPNLDDVMGDVTGKIGAAYTRPAPNERRHMKSIIAVAAAGLVSLTAIAPTPAHAQKDPACVEKCHRESKPAKGGPQQIRSNASSTGACVAACPAAGAAKKK
jgi:hypothetical protein